METGTLSRSQSRRSVDHASASAMNVSSSSLKKSSRENVSSHAYSPQKKTDRFSDMRLCLDSNQKEDMQEAFNIFDNDGDGKVDFESLKVTIRALGFEPNKEELRKMLDDVDPGGTWRQNGIPYKDFVTIVKKKMFEPDTLEDEIKMFRLLDHRNFGTITLSDLERVVSTLNLDVNEEELNEMMEMAGQSIGGGQYEVNLDRYIKTVRRYSH